MSKQFYFKQISLTLVRSLNVKTVLFKAIQFNISTQFSSIWPIDRTQSGATTPGQSWPGGNGNEGVLRIPQSSSITRASPSYSFVSYEVLNSAALAYWTAGHPLGESYPSGEMLSVYSVVLVD